MFCKKIKLLITIQLIAIFSIPKLWCIEPKTWTYEPGENDEDDETWRLVFIDEDTVSSQRIFAGILQDTEFEFKETSDTISTLIDDEVGMTIKVTPNELIYTDEDQTYRFVHKPEWDAKFDAALPVPKNKEDAVQTLLSLFPDDLKEEMANMKKEDLIGYHFGLGMTIRNSLGLWNPESPLRDDLGGGHPDDASMVLIEACWEKLQELEEQNRVAGGVNSPSPHTT